MNKPIIGFDFGTKRIGVAIADTITCQSRPLAPISWRSKTQKWQAIDALLGRWKPDQLVVGQALTMAGESQLINRQINNFINRIKHHYSCPIHLVDERLTSILAESMLQQQGRYERADVDQMAARIILQTWLSQTYPNAVLF